MAKHFTTDMFTRPFDEEFFEGEISPREVFRTPLSNGKEAVFFPTLGPIVEGHCLMVVDDPATSFAGLPKEIQGEVLGLAFDFRDFLRRVYTHEGAIIAEHGAIPRTGANLQVCSDPRAGACIDHAHLHISRCVGGSNVFSALSYETIGGRADHYLEELGDLSFLAGQPYLLVVPAQKLGWIWKDPATKFRPFDRQFARRALLMGIREDAAVDNPRFNWRRFPNLDVMEDTCRRLKRELADEVNALERGDETRNQGARNLILRNMERSHARG